MINTRYGIALSILAISLISACSGISSPDTNSPTGKEGIEMQTQVGQGGFIENTNLVIYPGAKGAGDVGETFVSWATSDSMENVTAFYKKELTDKGWTLNDSWSKGAKPPLPEGCTRIIATRKTEVVKIDLKPSPKDKTKTIIVPTTATEDNFLKANPELNPSGI